MGKTEEARKLLAELVLKAEEGQRIENMLHALLIQACVWDTLGQESGALDVLVRCLRVAQPEGYFTIFLDEGEPIYKLLKRLQNQALPLPLANYALRLIRAFEDRETFAGIQPAGSSGL